MKVRRGGLNIALVTLLLLGMGYLGLVLFLGTSSPFMLVRGTSMEPTFHTGDLLLSRSVSPTEIEVGDVIAFSVPAEERERLNLPSTAVHRVVGIEGEQGQLTFVTRGDNSALDPFKVPSSAVRGAVVRNLGPLGRPILFLTNRGVLLFLGLPILTFALIVLATLWLAPSEKREALVAMTKAKPRPKKRRRVGSATAAAGTPPGDLSKSLGIFATSMADYGVHLQSHTAVVKNLGETSHDLKRAVRQQSHNSLQLSLAVQRQNEVLTDLEDVVREMKGPTRDDDLPDLKKVVRELRTQAKKGEEVDAQASGNGAKTNGKGQKARASGNGHKKSSNGAKLKPRLPKKTLGNPSNENGGNGAPSIHQLIARAAAARGRQPSRRPFASTGTGEGQ
ncbi:MAG: signal peptidase I [Dehalococcoidia bacterium]